jgi:hypothetical protein
VTGRSRAAPRRAMPGAGLPRREGRVASDPDIERMARYLLDKYGAAAKTVAEERARLLERSGDKGAAAVWAEIAAAVAMLLEDGRP